MIRGTVVLAAWSVLAAAGAGAAWAQGAAAAKAKAKAPPSKAAPAKVEDKGKDEAPKPGGRALQKLREGSLLRRDGPLPSPPDVRGDYERVRDRYLTTHYQRLARLDWIEQLASKANQTRLLERVENVRRREIQRHRAAMTRLWEQARARQVVGFK